MKGFQRITAIANKIKKLGVDLQDGEFLRELIIRNEDFILDLNKSQLNDEGVNAKGEEIMNYAPYSPYTIKLKKGKGQPFDRVTLRDTGKFQAGFKLVVTPKTFRVTSSDGKAPGLIEKYGPYIFGLTPASKEKLIQDVLLPGLFEHIDNSLQQ